MRQHCEAEVRGEGEEFKEAPGSIWDPASGDITKGLVEDCM